MNIGDTIYVPHVRRYGTITRIKNSNVYVEIEHGYEALIIHNPTRIQQCDDLQLQLLKKRQKNLQVFCKEEQINQTTEQSQTKTVPDNSVLRKTVLRKTVPQKAFNPEQRGKSKLSDQITMMLQQLNSMEQENVGTD